jgi:hypothetical protein
MPDPALEAVVPPPPAAPLTQEQAAEARRSIRRNFALGVLNGVFINGAIACVNGQVVLAPLIFSLTGSLRWAGMMMQLSFAFVMLPQMLAAAFLERRARKMPVYRAAAVLRLAGWLSGGLALLWVGGGALGNLTLAALLTAAVILNGTGNGVAMLALQDIVGKVIAPEERQQYFGWRFFLGRGFLLLVAFLYVPYLLSPGMEQEWGFPRNYGLLFLSAFVFAAASVSVFFAVREPAGSAPQRTGGLGAHFRGGWELLRSEPRFQKLLLFRALTQLGLMAAPLLAVFAFDAQRGLGLTGVAVGEGQGLFLRCLAGAECVTAGLWAFFGRRLSAGAGLLLGTASRLVMALAACALGPALSHLDASPGVRLWAVAAVFVLQGAAGMTLLIETEALVLDLAPEERRPSFIGFLNTLSFPLLIGAPLLGSFIVEQAGYTFAFGAMAVFNLGALLVARALRRIKQAARAGCAPREGTET